MMQVPINTAKKIVEKFVKKTMGQLKDGVKVDHTPIYLHSSPGLGKSSVIRQLAEENGLGFVDLRLASMEASDVCGIPYVSHAGQADESMKFSIPSWFPSVEKVEAGVIPASGIVFFDELSNAPVAVQHAAYRIILDREVQTGVEMAPGWMVIAAGNLRSDKTGAKDVAPALANRFATHIGIKPDLDSFNNYAIGAGINHHILGFLSFKPNMLYSFDPTKNGTSFASPRSWEQAGKILDMGLSANEEAIALAGCIGTELSNEFGGFRQYYGKLPNFEKIMDGEETYKVPTNDVGLVFAVTSSVINCLMNNYEKPERLANLEKIMTQLGDDFLVMVYKSLKNCTNEKAISAIMLATMSTFGRVNKYIRADSE